MSVVRLALAIFAGTSATAAFGALLWSAWIRTIGRRRVARDRLSRLTSGVRIAFVENLLGTSRTRREGDGWVEWVWVDPLYYVQACTHSGSEAIERLAITSRDRRFRPEFTAGDTTVQLHRSTFASVFSSVDKLEVSVGARRAFFGESKYLANPGSYMTLTVAVTDAAISNVFELKDFSAFEFTGTYTQDTIPPELREFRRRAVVNTFSVRGPLNDEPDPFSIGADLDLVRFLAR